MRLLVIFVITISLGSCRPLILSVNAKTPCGNPRMISLVQWRGSLTADQKIERDSLVKLCVGSEPCDNARMLELINLPYDLTAVEYAESDSLHDDCDNWLKLRPAPWWHYALGIYVVGGVVGFIVLIHAISKFRLGL